jgi:methionine-rich copper-binding protein CopC
LYSRIRAAGVALLLGAGAALANAQAVLVSSVPPPGASVSAGDFAFHLRFNGLIDHERSRLFLTHPDGSVEYLVIAEVGPPQELTSLARLAAGSYVLHWDALQVGGHITSGSLSFTVSPH